MVGLVRAPDVSALESFTRQMKKANLRESLTTPRSEMARHDATARRLNIDI
jgi:hypothetical protein